MREPVAFAVLRAGEELAAFDDLAQQFTAALEVEVAYDQGVANGFVEVQGTAEGRPFDRTQLDALLDLAVGGCASLTALQKEALAS